MGAFGYRIDWCILLHGTQHKRDNKIAYACPVQPELVCGLLHHILSDSSALNRAVKGLEQTDFKKMVIILTSIQCWDVYSRNTITQILLALFASIILLCTTRNMVLMLGQIHGKF